MSHGIKKETMGLKKKRRRSAKFSYLDPVVPEEDKSSVHRVFCESVSALVKKTTLNRVISAYGACLDFE